MRRQTWRNSIAAPEPAIAEQQQQSAQLRRLGSQVDLECAGWVVRLSSISVDRSRTSLHSLTHSRLARRVCLRGVTYVWAQQSGII